MSSCEIQVEVVKAKDRVKCEVSEQTMRQMSEYLEIKNEGGRDVDQCFVCKDSSGGG